MTGIEWLLTGQAWCRTIAPFNEPSSIYWWAGNNQEGCHFSISTQNIIIGKLQAMLQQKGLAEVNALASTCANLKTPLACSSCLDITLGNS